MATCAVELRNAADQVVSSFSESEIVAGGCKVKLTLTGDQWIAAGSGAYIYPYGVESDFSSVTTSDLTDIALLDSITTVGAVTLTKLCVKISNVLSATQGWIALYNSDGSSRLAWANFTPATGWNDVTISYAASASTSYLVMVECNSNVNYYYHSNTGTNSWYRSLAYNATPPDSASGSPTDTADQALRVGY